VKVQVHFDELGQIVGVVEVREGETDRPPAGVILPRKFRMLETQLDREEPLIVVHTGHRVDLQGKEPRLTRIERASKPKRGS
jgi:hypothetical protein